jgi:hypothetical protein
MNCLVRYVDKAMKTLLLTDVPPCSNYTGGLVVAQMCRFLPAGDLVVFCAQNAYLKPEPVADLADLSIVTVAKPDETPRREMYGMRIGVLGSWAVETARRTLGRRALVDQAVAFGRQHGVTSLWAILEGQTIVRMTNAVAARLGVPLRCQVWDPLAWWLRAHGVDSWNRRWDLALFDRTIRRSVACATASWKMAESYAMRYGVTTVPVVASLDRALARSASPAPRCADTLVIGMAGQFYAVDAWASLVEALNRASWTVGGRAVSLRVFGKDCPVDGIPPGRLDFRGWQSQQAVIGALAETCDLLYCPYPFDADMADVSRLSFPSKLGTYFAAARPILFHGPADSSPASYLRAKQAGWICATRNPDAVAASLVRLGGDAALYRRLAIGAHAAFADFTLETMRAATLRFLGYRDEPAPYSFTGESLRETGGFGDDPWPVPERCAGNS